MLPVSGRGVEVIGPRICSVLDGLRCQQWTRL